MLAPFEATFRSGRSATIVPEVNSPRESSGADLSPARRAVGPEKGPNFRRRRAEAGRFGKESGQTTPLSGSKAGRLPGWGRPERPLSGRRGAIGAPPGTIPRQFTRNPQEVWGLTGRQQRFAGANPSSWLGYGNSGHHDQFRLLRCDKRLRTAFRVLGEANIAEHNRTLIRKYLAVRQSEGIGTWQIIKTLYHLVELAKILPLNFDAADRDDIAGMISTIEARPYAAWTKSDYESCASASTVGCGRQRNIRRK